MLVNGRPILRDYKSGYTLEMLAQKYKCSTHSILEVVYELTVKGNKVEKYLEKIELMGKLELNNFKEKVLRSELERDKRVALIAAIEVRENVLNNTHHIEPMAENGELKMEEL